jgi:hypothetical protein
MPVRLVHTPTGKSLTFGDTITDFRGETTTIKSMRPPHKESSVGFVNNFYASVYDCKYVENDE